MPPSLELVLTNSNDQNHGANVIGDDHEDPSEMPAEEDDNGCASQDTARTQGDRMDTETEGSQPGSEIQETQIYDAAPVYGEVMDTKKEDTQTESEIQETQAYENSGSCRGEPQGPGNKRPREDEGHESEAQHSENNPRQVKVPR